MTPNTILQKILLFASVQATDLAQSLKDILWRDLYIRPPKIYILTAKAAILRNGRRVTLGGKLEETKYRVYG